VGKCVEWGSAGKCGGSVIGELGEVGSVGKWAGKYGVGRVKHEGGGVDVKGEWEQKERNKMLTSDTPRQLPIGLLSLLFHNFVIMIVISLRHLCHQCFLLIINILR
jgi:hypothetical protein